MAFSPEIRSELDAYLFPWQEVCARNMFGSMVYMVGSKMFAFLRIGRLVVKLPKEDMAEAREPGDATPFIHGHNGRFGDWMEFPLTSLDGIEGLLPWVRKSYQYVQIAPGIIKGRSRRRK